ncbi:hypothetical protein BKA80DRAFT_27330 [Phyllosticta citrichinensis]
MTAPAVKGAIIAVSVAVAAGIAIYQSPQVQRWLDERRRKIAVALHKLGDEINPPTRQFRAPGETEEQWTKRQETIRQRRNELIKRAREEGVAVDLDELARISETYDEKRPTTRSSTLDDLVHNDGTLRESGPATVNEKAITTGTDNTASENLRLRGQGARGFMSGALYAQTFGDEDASILFDRDLIGVEENSVDGDHDEEAVTPHDFVMDSRETTATVEAQPASSLPQLIDVSEPVHADGSETTGEAATESYYSSASHAAGPTIQESPAVSVIDDSDFDDDHMAHSTGTLTPTEDNFSTDASLVGRGADDIAVLSSLHNVSTGTADVSSNPFGSQAELSETGFSDAHSDASYSDLDGAATPSSWTDVGSDAGSDYGSHAGN